MVDLKAAREKAKRLAGANPETWGWFQHQEDLLAAREVPRTSKWWAEETLLPFWRTGKRTLFAAVGLRGIKSSTTSRAAVAEALFRARKAVMGGSFVWPALAASKKEASGRVLNIRFILRTAYEFTEIPRKTKGEEMGGEIVPRGAYAYSHSGTTGVAIIEFQDADGNMVAFQAGPANLSAVREYTGIGGLYDEWDHVPTVGPDGEEPAFGGAHKILDYGLARLAGQPGAHAYVISNPTVDTACLSAACAAGDGPETFIARLGERGALKLEQDFKRLASRLATTDPKLSRDKRLHEEQDPNSWRVPTHIANETITAEECFALARDSSKRSGEDDPLGTFFRIYCARSIAGAGGMIPWSKIEGVPLV